ncbi:hypothetical protein BJX99DRAFT_239778 [Aspergillus californicus]
MVKYLLKAGLFPKSDIPLGSDLGYSIRTMSSLHCGSTLITLMCLLLLAHITSIERAGLLGHPY